MTLFLIVKQRPRNMLMNKKIPIILDMTSNSIRPGANPSQIGLINLSYCVDRTAMILKRSYLTTI